MIKKRLLSILIILILSTFQLVNATSTSNLSFHGVGLDVTLAYPKEANPQTEIFHNITLTAKTDLTLNLFSLEIFEPINQTLELIVNPTITIFPMAEDDSLSIPVNFTTNSQTRGNLFCTIYITTNQDSDYFSNSFYTTQIEPIPFSELVTMYAVTLSEFETLQNLYENKKDEFDSLKLEYEALVFANNQKIQEYNQLLENNTRLNANVTDLKGNFDSLYESYNNLVEDYDSLETEYALLQINLEDKENNLSVDRIVMIMFIIILVGLIFLIIYIKNRQKEPYVVIRKETVSMKPEKK